MSAFPDQDPNSPKGSGVDPSHYQQLGSLTWSFVIGVIFFLVSWQQKLQWAPWIIIVMGGITLVITHKKRLYFGLQPVKAALIYFIASALCMFVEGQYLIHGPIIIEDPLPVSEVAVEDLPGIYTGFRIREGRPPSHVVFTIEKFIPEPSRTLCRYSINEDLRLYQGQALLYTTTRTLALKDGTSLRYERKNGQIVLWAITGPPLQLTRLASQ